MKQNRLLMLNASMHDVPLILEARKLGFYVITTSNKPEYPGHRFSDEYVNCDYTDLDSLIELCNEFGIEAVSCGTSDNASYSAAYLGEHFGWKGHDSLMVTKTLHNKDLFKVFTKENKIQSPISIPYSNEQEAISEMNKLSFPLIVKPVDCAGGQGISVVNSKATYIEAVKNAFYRSKEKRIVIEPYIQGSQHSFSSFIVDRRVVNYCAWDDLSYPGRYMISKGSIPASYRNPDYIENKVIEEIEKIANKLHLVDGLFHLQFIVQNGEPYIIEVMRRTPGNWDTYLTTNVSGINWDQWIIMAESGMDCHAIPKNRYMNGFWGYYMILGDRAGIVKGFTIDDRIQKNIFRKSYWVDEGYQIIDYQHEKLGLVHLWFSSMEEMKEKMSIIDELIEVEYK